MWVLLSVGIAVIYLCIVSVIYGAMRRLRFEDIDAGMFAVFWPITLMYFICKPFGRRLAKVGGSFASWVTTPRVKPPNLPRAVAKEGR